MPRLPKTHEDFRKIICLFCNKKVNQSVQTIRRVTGKLLEKVKQIKGFENYDEKDERFPISCCSQHYNIVNRKKLDEVHLYLPQPYDYRQFSPPKITRSSTVCAQACLICDVGKQGSPVIQKGFGIKTKPKPRLSSLPPRKWIRVCQRCYHVVGKGFNHPSNCGLTEFRESVQNLLESDPYGYEIAVGKFIRSKFYYTENNEPKVLPTITIGSPTGKKMILPKPIRQKSYVSRALFTNNRPVEFEEWEKMKSLAHLNGHQSEVVAAFHRQWYGRHSIKPYLAKNSRVRSHCLQEFYSTKTCLLESSDKSEAEKGLVKRPVALNIDMKASNQHVCNIRGYPNMKDDTYFQFGADSGGGFFKINGIIRNVTEACKSNSSDDSENATKWSYKNGIMADKLKDTGVRRLILFGNTYYFRFYYNYFSKYYKNLFYI